MNLLDFFTHGFGEKEVIQFKSERLYADFCSLKFMSRLSTIEMTILRYLLLVNKVMNIINKKGRLL